MSRKTRKQRTGGQKVPEEVEDFIFSIFLELGYSAQSLEDAVRIVVDDRRRKGFGVVKQYMCHVEEDEHDVADLERALKAAAQRGGYFVEGDTRGFFCKYRRS